MIDLLEKKRKVALIITILLAIEVFYVSGISGTQAGQSGFVFDISVLYHFIVFFLFSFFLFAAIKGDNKVKMKHLLFVLAISVLFSFSDEIHQMFVPMRIPDLFDILVDTTGIFSSVILYVYVNYKEFVKRN